MRLRIDRLLRAGFLLAAVGWTIALPLAAAFAATPHARASEYLFAALAYTVGGIICHQQAGRSFHLWGVQLPVCARCTGIYLGAALAVVFVAGRACRARPDRGPDDGAPHRDRAVLFASCVPIALTLVFEWTTGITPSNTIRAISGLPLGAAVSWLVLSPRRAQ